MGDIFAESKNILSDSGLRSSFMISRSTSVRVLSKRVKKYMANPIILYLRPFLQCLAALAVF
ncbi:MAG: hypothetical protein ACPG9H_00455, partial [Candidatus Puniceispirillaceae bacterium]